MIWLSKLLYHLFVRLYLLGIHVAAVWNPKAKKWVAGRRHQSLPTLLKTLQQHPQRIWMHCASLGEFEQGRPLLEAIRLHYPNAAIALSFFSPSGYEIQQHYKGADAVFYLPIDQPNNAAQILHHLQPTLVLWVKYEYWFGYLQAIHQQNIPLLLVSGIFRPGQPFFKWYGAYWRKMLDCFSFLLVQNEASLLLLQEIGKNAIIAGDTRFDRVMSIAESPIDLPLIAAFCRGKKVMVAGSTWEEDEEELVHYINKHPGIQFIIAPHEVQADNIKEVQQRFPAAVLYSDWINGHQPNNCHVLIINNVGLLSKLYYYADICFVGGGFGDDGVHNVLEAAVYGKPVLFGPVYEKFAEAVGLEEAGGGISVAHALELESVINQLWEEPDYYQQTSNAARQYVAQHAGATQLLMNLIYEKRLLTN